MARGEMCAGIQEKHSVSDLAYQIPAGQAAGKLDSGVICTLHSVAARSEKTVSAVKGHGGDRPSTGSNALMRS